MTFENFINESTTTVYHGGDTSIAVNNNYSSMYHQKANVQEGIGIYFTPEKEVAETYGKVITSINVQSNKLLPSRSIVSKVLSKSQVTSLLKELAKNYEEFWLMATDYGFEVNDNDELSPYYSDFAGMLMDNEVRNFQIELVQNTSVEAFVKSWIKTIPYNGTFNKQNKFYAIMKE